MNESDQLESLERRVQELEGKLDGTHFLLAVLVAELAVQGYSGEKIGELGAVVADNYENAEGFRTQGEALDDVVGAIVNSVRSALDEQDSST